MKTITVKTKAKKALEAAGFINASKNNSGYALDKMDSGAFKLYWSMAINNHNGIAQKQLGRMTAALDQAGLQPYIQYVGSHLVLKGEDILGEN